MTEKWLSVDEIAKHFSISKETVYCWLERRKIPAQRNGKLWKLKVSEVDDWVIQGGAGPNGTKEWDGSSVKGSY